MLPITYIGSNRLTFITGIGAILFFSMSLLAYNIIHAQSSSPALSDRVAVTSPGHVSLSTPATTSSSTASTSDVKPIPNINIASDGLVLLHDAQVVAVSGSRIDVTVSFGGMDFPWVVETNPKTKFPTTGGASQTFANIQTDDIITVTGTLAGAGAEPSINAQFVRE